MHSRTEKHKQTEGRAEKRDRQSGLHTHTHTHTDIQRDSDLATVDKLDGSFTEEEIDEVADLVR